MSSSTWSLISSMNPLTVILVFMGVLFIAREVTKLIQDLFSMYGIQTKGSVQRKECTETIQKYGEDIKELKNATKEQYEMLESQKVNRSILDSHSDQLQKLMDANREMLADRINVRYKEYFKQGFIPSDELDEFIKLHSVYNGVGGNHTGDAKFKKCMTLPVVDLEKGEQNNG